MTEALFNKKKKKEEKDLNETDFTARTIMHNKLTCRHFLHQSSLTFIIYKHAVSYGEDV